MRLITPFYVQEYFCKDNGHYDYGEAAIFKWEDGNKNSKLMMEYEGI